MAKKWLSDIDRFMKSVEIVPDSCWIWTGRLDRDGYAPQFKIGSRTDNTRTQVRAARWIYETSVGPIPDGKTIDHLCRIRCCVNPEHLELVSTRENTQRNYRSTKLYCRQGHPLFGDNLKIGAAQRICKTCRRAAVRAHYRSTDGAAQKKYAQEHREERRLAQAARKARWTDERREHAREYQRQYDAHRRQKSA